MSKGGSSEREVRDQEMRVFGIQVVHNAVGIFGSRTEFENHPGYRMVYMILTVEGRRVTSERDQVASCLAKPNIGSYFFLLCSIHHLWRCKTAH